MYFVFNTIFFFEISAVYEIMWKNIVQPNRQQMTTWRMRIACWIPKATKTLGLCNIYCFSTATVIAWTWPNVTLYLQCLACVTDV